MRSTVTAIGVAVTGALAGCGVSESDVYTLYRSSPMDRNMRVHVSTFDAADGSRYNNENCQIGRDLYQGQPGVTVRYWCEKGRYKE